MLMMLSLIVQKAVTGVVAVSEIRITSYSDNRICYGAMARLSGIQLHEYGLRSRWRRPAWVQIPPPAPEILGSFVIILNCIDALDDFKTNIFNYPRRNCRFRVEAGSVID